MSSIDDWIPRLLKGLRPSDAGPTAEDVADALWLATWLRPAGPYTRPADAVAPAVVAPPGRTPKPSDAPTPPADRPPGEPAAAPAAAALHIPTAAGGPAEAGGRGTVLRAPAPSALPHAMDLIKALRPLMRRRPSRRRMALDEAATVRRLADERVADLVLRPTPQRWLKLALVLDIGPSMELWRPMFGELRAFLERMGGFARVRTWNLETGRPPPRLYPPLRRRPGDRPPRRPQEPIDPTGDQLVLIVTDCISPSWHDGSAAGLIRQWSRFSQVALLQVLPDYLWPRTALRDCTEVSLSAPRAAAPNARLRASRPLDDWSPEDDTEGSAEVVRVPVVSLRPQSLADLARVVAGSGGAGVTGFELPLHPPAATPAGAVSGAARDPSAEAEVVVSRFWRTASPPARELARLLAAAPVITLPIVRLLRHNLLTGRGRQSHEAEVLLGGLLRAAAGTAGRDADPDAVEYEFREAVRARLLDASNVTDVRAVLQTISRQLSRYIEQRMGQATDFEAILANPAALTGPMLPATSPVAAVTAQVLERLGGEYARMVRILPPGPGPGVNRDHAGPEWPDGLADLRGWAAVAFAARCARRLLPLLRLTGGPDPNRIDAAAAATRYAERLASGGNPPALPEDVTGRALTESFAGDVLNAVNAAKEGGDPTRYAALAATRLIEAAGPHPQWPQWPAALRAAMDADVRRLKELSDRPPSADAAAGDSRFSPSALGPLWPQGSPEGWPVHYIPGLLPRAWVVVFDAAAPAGHEAREAGRLLGEFLADEGFGVIGSRPSGRDAGTVAAFARGIYERGYEESDFGEWGEPVEDAVNRMPADAYRAVAFIGGDALAEHQVATILRYAGSVPVLPLAATGGAARQVFERMLEAWSRHPVFGMSRATFERLGLPVFPAVEAMKEYLRQQFPARPPGPEPAEPHDPPAANESASAPSSVAPPSQAPSSEASPSEAEASEAAHPGRLRVLVAGSGGYDLSRTVESVSRQLGAELARAGFALVTGGWPGVDYVTCDGFARALRERGEWEPDRITVVHWKERKPDYPDGERVVVADYPAEYRESVRIADAVVLIAGKGGTRQVGEMALAAGKLVLPLAGTGTDATAVFQDMLAGWGRSPPLGLQGVKREEFEGLAGPAEAALGRLMALLRTVLSVPAGPGAAPADAAVTKPATPSRPSRGR